MYHDLQTIVTTHTITTYYAEPHGIRSSALPPGDELLFDSRLNRCRVVVVVVVVVVGVVGRSSSEEALERLSLRIVRNL